MVQNAIAGGTGFSTGHGSLKPAGLGRQPEGWIAQKRLDQSNRNGKITVEKETVLFMKKIILFCALLTPMLAPAQTYSINWYKVAGGGGSSSGTNGSAMYSLSGTIGQQDASTAMTGGNYSLTGGFWSLISLVQTPGAPTLSIAQSGNSVIVSWPDIGNYTLQQNNNLSMPSGWAGTGYSTNTSNGTNSITITPPTGSLFFRLFQ
jgi:hypothetical protein